MHRTYYLEAPETHVLLVQSIVHSQEPGLVLVLHIACFVVWWNGLLPCRHQHGRCDASTCSIQRPMTLHQLLRVLLHQALEIMFLHLLQIRGVHAETWMRRCVDAENRTINNGAFTQITPAIFAEICGTYSPTHPWMLVHRLEARTIFCALLWYALHTHFVVVEVAKDSARVSERYRDNTLFLTPDGFPPQAT